MSMNDIFSMMQKMTTPASGVESSINNKFGNIENALKILSGIIGKKGINPKNTVLEQLKGKTFSPEVINDFRQFAKKAGMSDDVIDNALREANLLK